MTISEDTDAGARWLYDVPGDTPRRTHPLSNTHPRKLLIMLIEPVWPIIQPMDGRPWTQETLNHFAETQRPATYFGGIHDRIAWENREQTRFCLAVAMKNVERGDLCIADCYIRRAIRYGARLSRIRPLFSRAQWLELRRHEQAQSASHNS